MTDLERDISHFLLRRLLQKNGDTATSTELKLGVRAAFNVAFTDGDLNGFIAQLEDGGFIAGTNDALSGMLWALTPKGKINAQRLRGGTQ